MFLESFVRKNTIARNLHEVSGNSASNIQLSDLWLPSENKTRKLSKKLVDEWLLFELDGSNREIGVWCSVLRDATSVVCDVLVAQYLYRSNYQNLKLGQFAMNVCLNTSRAVSNLGLMRLL